MGVTTAPAAAIVDVDVVDAEVDAVDAVDDVPYVHVVQSTAGQLILACFLGTGLRFWSFWSWERRGAFFVRGIAKSSGVAGYGSCPPRENRSSLL